jgi:hypothetical protein
MFEKMRKINEKFWAMVEGVKSSVSTPKVAK